MKEADEKNICKEPTVNWQQNLLKADHSLFATTKTPLVAS